MKIFIVYARENWITDVLYREWVENNKELHTTNIHEADTIWILSNYIIGNIPIEFLKTKRVITTIHHITPWKITPEKKKHYAYVNEVTDIFQTNNIKNEKFMKEIGFTKPIITVPLWNNENIWKSIDVKRVDLGLPEDAYLVGSFQRDTEGAGIPMGIYKPKLEKGPDIFIKTIELLRYKHENLQVVLTGRCRQYVMNELKRIGIVYHYFEMCNMKQLNELYNAIDLYIVASRVEGGPRAINEAALTKTSLYSTDVGIATDICHRDSIFDMNKPHTVLECRADTEWNYQQAMKYSIANHMENFTKTVFMSR